MPSRPGSRFGGNRLPDGWEKGETLNKIPFYINHKQEITQWDHPVLEQGGRVCMGGYRFLCRFPCISVRASVSVCIV